MYFTTEQQGLSLINSNCPSETCKIVGKSAKLYDGKVSAFHKLVSSTLREPKAVGVYDRDDYDLQVVGFKGVIASDEFLFSLR